MTPRWCWYHTERLARYRAEIVYGPNKRRIVYCHDLDEVEREEGETLDRRVSYTPVNHANPSDWGSDPAIFPAAENE